MSTPAQDEIIRPTVDDRYYLMVNAPPAVKAAAAAMISRFEQLKFQLPFTADDVVWTDLADVALRAGCAKGDEPQPWTSPAAADSAEGWLLLHALYIVLQHEEIHGERPQAVMAEVRNALIRRGHVVERMQDVNANAR